MEADDLRARDYITPSADTVFRFVARDVTLNGTIVEAGLDDFEISGDLGPVAVEEYRAATLALDLPHPNPPAAKRRSASPCPRPRKPRSACTTWTDR